MDLQRRVAGESLIADGTRRIAAHCTQINPLSMRCNTFDCARFASNVLRYGITDFRSWTSVSRISISIRQ